MKTKQFILSILILSLFLLFMTSCGKNEQSDDIIIENFTVENSLFTYETYGHLKSWDVNNNGILYYLTQYSEMEDGTIIKSYIRDSASFHNMIIGIDLEGNIINELNIGMADVDKIIASDNNVLYLTTPNYLRIQKIFSLDLNTGELKELFTIDDFIGIKNTVIIDNTLYFIGIEKLATGKEYKIFDYLDDFFYYGEIIRSYNIETGEMKDIYTELPINITKTPQENLMIYAYDENGGYCFFEYDTKKKIFGEKTYKTFTALRDFTTDFIVTEKSKQILFKIHDLINVSNLSINAPIAELVKDIDTFSNKIVYESGCLFYKSEEGFTRVWLEEFHKSSVILNMGYTERGADFPDSNRYFINNTELNYDEFALSVLSGNSDIDFYLINSHHSFADNIRNKGAFYPLTDIEGVTEYLDAIFPYVKDSAINKNGDVWMIPTSLNSTSISYNENVWDRYNIDIDTMKDLNELVDVIYNLSQERVDESYQLLAYPTIRKCFYQLIEKNKGFERNDFKIMAEYCYKKLNYIKNGASVLINETSKKDYDSLIGGLLNSLSIDDHFSYIAYGFHETDLEQVINSNDFDDYKKALNDLENSKRTSVNINNYKYLRHKNLPPIENFNKNEVTIEFFYVNPNSKNLDTVLEYISAYCKEKINERNSFILKDKSTYDNRVYINDFYDIYNSDNYVSFGLSGDLFFEDFEKFLGDEISIDEYLDRVEYKINAYLNE